MLEVSGAWQRGIKVIVQWECKPSSYKHPGDEIWGEKNVAWIKRSYLFLFWLKLLLSFCAMLKLMNLLSLLSLLGQFPPVSTLYPHYAWMFASLKLYGGCYLLYSRQQHPANILGRPFFFFFFSSEWFLTKQRASLQRTRVVVQKIVLSSVKERDQVNVVLKDSSEIGSVKS